jgi:spermidine synthase
VGRQREIPGTITAQVDFGVARLVPDAHRQRAWELTVDGTPQSHVDLDDPSYLLFEYTRRIGHVLDHTAPRSAPLRVLHLGGGALTLPRYVAATRPGSSQQVVEADAALVELVRRELPLDRGSRIRIRHGDAREVMSHAPDDAFDVVISDVFARATTPAHLTTREYVLGADRVLRSGGVFVANVGDTWPLEYARSQIANTTAVFEHVCAISDPGTLNGRRFGNVVIVGSHQPLPIAALTRHAAGDVFQGRLLEGAALARFTSGRKPVTDATAAPSPTPPRGIFG